MWEERNHRNIVRLGRVGARKLIARKEKMLAAIQNNPFRVLGVYSNSPKKDIVANKGKMSAFLRVGREVSFPLDLTGILPTIQRDNEIVGNADSELSLSAGQLKHGLFWFIKVTPIDDIAFNHLLAGNTDTALEIWEKRQSMSSLQNRIVLYFIKGEYRLALSCAQTLYDSYTNELVKTIAGETYTCTSEELIHDFIDRILDEKALNPQELLDYIDHSDWVTYIKRKLVNPLIGQIEEAINDAKNTAATNASANYDAGIRLSNSTKPLLSQLKELIPRTDLQYQIIADKLGLQILQCGINYYNKSDDDDAAHKAMALQKYAMSVVVGDMAKDRCNENVRILEGIIAKLPPKEVMSEYRAVMKELEAFCKRPDLISHAVTLLNNTKPHLQAIKNKLGISNSYYLKLSTQVVGNALHNIIEEVNAAQNADEDDNDDLLGGRTEQKRIFAAIIKMELVKKALESAWNAILIMDAFDLEADFKINRYNPNRSTLKGMCEQLGIKTSSYRKAPVVSKPASRPASPGPKPTATFVSKEPIKEKKELNFFVAVLIIHVIWGIISAMNGENFFLGFAYGVMGWIIPINMLAYGILSWIYEKINE